MRGNSGDFRPPSPPTGEGAPSPDPIRNRGEAGEALQRNFYGRRHGKALKPNQRRWLEEDLPGLALPGVSRAENPERRPLDLAARFGARPLWLEVGFGGGEHLAHLATRHPEVALIGVEVYLNGVAMALGKLRAAGVTVAPGAEGAAAGPLPNLALHHGDVRDLLELLPPASLSRCYLLYPDPWPKARHHRRRFVTSEYLLPLARALRPGAELRLATDIPDYVRQAVEEVPAAGFALAAQGGAPWEGWLSTRYEQKALREGRVPHYLIFRRL